jgi:CheY-like chemotaxis protein
LDCVVKHLGRDPRALPDLSGLKAVIADDMECVRSIVRRLLAVAGVRHITMARDGVEAWDMVCTYKPDLLITDWQMGGKAGIDLLRDVRRSPRTPNPYMAIMMISSFAEEHRIRRALSEGTTCYLAKPFSAAQFFSKLKFCVEDEREFELELEYFGPKRPQRPPETMLHA